MIESLEKLFPYGDTILTDDQSNNTQLLNYLNQLSGKGIPVFSTTINKSLDLYKGGLYHAMDQGMKYEIDHGYDYVNYLQDDIQCIKKYSFGWSFCKYIWTAERKYAIDSGRFEEISSYARQLGTLVEKSGSLKSALVALGEAFTRNC